MVTHCGHHFHDWCLLEHFKENNFCPYDRRELFPDRDNFDNVTRFKDLYAVLPDVVAKLQPSEYLVRQLHEKMEIIHDDQIVSLLIEIVIPRVVNGYNFWLTTLIQSDMADEWIQALSFSDEAIAYYTTARFIDLVKPRLGLKLWLKLEKIRRGRLDAYLTYKASDEYVGDSEEDWFLDAIVPEHSYTNHLAYIFGLSEMVSVLHIEAAIETTGGNRQDTIVDVQNPGEALDLQFGHGKDGLRIQLLHGQVLKITDFRGVGTLSKIKIDVNIKDRELFLEDSAGTLYTFLFKFEESKRRKLSS